ncbi:hypothetical protein LARV_03432 [Longilinea arvoryzae]|uniref:Uncharacterized protein n=2 Tax=Longilinea arvoryzae TaxID=360412 RepID=A0A0S7BMW9_9CHLR|nr:hypothetical protein LARV_03432 [Longilinea arvoryzae]
MLSQEFFELNLAFAEKMAALVGQPLPDALFEWTHCYLAFGLGREFYRDHPLWQDFLGGLAAAQDRAGFTYRFYLNHYRPKTPLQHAFGCFSYDPWDGGRIRLHFRDAEQPQFLPLSRARAPVRKAELKALFADVRANLPQAQSVVGGSWLYHLEAYRRLFPPAFLASARPSPDLETRYLTLWGQFLHRDGSLRLDSAARFRRCFEQKNTPSEALGCFPLSVLWLEAPLDVFYTHYCV